MSEKISIGQILVELTLMRRKLVRVNDSTNRLFKLETCDYSWSDLERAREKLESQLIGLYVQYIPSEDCYVLIPKSLS